MTDLNEMRRPPKMSKDLFQDSRGLLNLFYPGSFPDPLRLPLEEEPARKTKPEKAPKKVDLTGPFLKRKEAIQLLKTRSTLERCEKSGWLVAVTRQPRLVLYKRVDVMACVYRISQGEYPAK
jgi:hypothetical protein